MEEHHGFFRSSVDGQIYRNGKQVNISSTTMYDNLTDEEVIELAKIIERYYKENPL